MIRSAVSRLDLRLFDRARSLYDVVSRQKVDAEPDHVAWGVVQKRFLDYCLDRAVV